MIDTTEKYYCDHCDKVEYSSTGDPFRIFQKLTYTLSLCDSCYKQEEELQEEVERMANEVEDEGVAVSNGIWLKNFLEDAA